MVDVGLHLCWVAGVGFRGYCRVETEASAKIG